MKKKLPILFVAFSPFFIGCRSNIETTNISDVKMCMYINGNQCYNDNTNFSPSTPEIFISCLLKRAPAKTEVVFSWFYFGQTKVKITSITVNSGSKTGTLNLQSSLLKPNNDWPVGEYEVTITIANSNNEPVVKKFTIQ